MTASGEALTALLDAPPTGREQVAVYYNGQTWRFTDLAAQSLSAAKALAALGIGRGDRVALWLPNIPAYLVLNFACARLGAVAVAVNTRYRAVEVADIVARSGAAALAYWPDFRGIDFSGILEEVDAAALADLRVVIRYGDGGQPPVAPEKFSSNVQIRDYSELAAPAKELGGTVPLDGNAESYVNIFTTSGTTSKPKFVLHRQSGLTHHARDVARHFGYDRADGAILQAMPLCGVFGYCQALAALASGRPMVMLDRFDAAAAVQAIDRHRVAHMNATDDMIWAMLQTTDREIAFPHIEFCGYARFNTELADIAVRAEKRGLTLVGLYGMSEVQALFALRRPDDPDDVRDQGGGHLVSPKAAVRVRDPETGELLGIGGHGELEVAGPSVMAGYDNNPEATADTISADGFVKTGDLGYLTGPRSFVFLSRMGDVLRLGGFLVAPAEIEAHIQNLPGVAGCQVVGAESETGMRAVAFVVQEPGAGLSPEDILAHCRGQLARYKVPAIAVFVDDFPTTKSANGTKIQRAKLREMAAELV